jgi:hypothetical protein
MNVRIGKRNALATTSRKLPFPVPPNLKVAQIMAGKLFDGVKSFPPDHWGDLQRFKPRMLLGSASELLCLAEHMKRRGIEFPTVDRAVLVVTEIGERPADDVLRVVLWQAFAVPVYEIFVGPGNRLMGFECEAHDGWHMEPGVRFGLRNGELVIDGPGGRALATGLRTKITAAPCPCGRPEPRVIPRPHHVVAKRPLLAFAATA